MELFAQRVQPLVDGVFFHAGGFGQFLHAVRIPVAAHEQQHIALVKHGEESVDRPSQRGRILRQRDVGKRFLQLVQRNVRCGTASLLGGVVRNAIQTQIAHRFEQIRFNGIGCCWWNGKTGSEIKKC